MISSKNLTRAVLLVVVAAGAIANVNAQSSCVAIASLPITLNAPGQYCLTGSLSSNALSGAAISVSAADVAIDLGGNMIDGSAAGATSTAAAIFYNSQLRGFRLSNGTIRGFASATNAASFASNPNAVVIENLRVESSRGNALIVVGDHSVLRRVVIDGVTPLGAATSATGIVGVGNRMRFLNNDISGIAEIVGGVGHGISCTGCTGAIYENNRISGGIGAGTFRGLFVGASSVVRRNAINNADEGVRFFGTGSKYQDNLTTQVTTAFVGTATDAGGNN